MDVLEKLLALLGSGGILVKIIQASLTNSNTFWVLAEGDKLGGGGVLMVSSINFGIMGVHANRTVYIVISFGNFGDLWEFSNFCANAYHFGDAIFMCAGNHLREVGSKVGEI